MDFFLTRDSQIDFWEEFPRGISGKFGNVPIELLYEAEDEISAQAKACFQSLKRMIDTYDFEVLMTVGIIVKDEPKGEGILQLQLDDTINFLRDVRMSPGVDNVTVKVTLYDVQNQSTDEITPPEIYMLSNEMEVLLEDNEKTCQDYHLQFPDGWAEMFQNRDEKLTARITVGIIINTPTGAVETNVNSMELYKKMLEDDSYKDVTLVVQGDKRVKCHKLFLAACSPVFAAMFQSDMKEAESQTVEIPDMTEEGVKAFLEYVYHQAKDKPNENCGIAFELLYGAHKYEVAASDMEASMKQIFLTKPADWYDVDVALKLFQFARILPSGEELKLKAAHVLKMNVATFQLSPTCREMFQKNPEAAAELFQLAIGANP